MIRPAPRLGAASLPEGEVPDRAFSSLVGHWADVELNAATKWLDLLPASKSRDSDVRSFRSRVAENDPQAAFPWAGTIADASARTGAVEQVTRSWLQNDKWPRPGGFKQLRYWTTKRAHDCYQNGERRRRPSKWAGVT
ncbi:MAG: hypothetical protein M3463_05580 [Verrucomicrobiota bacterium]|nr:hypothetical protein [Verrucomicrobiota bacterium]